MHWCRLRLLLLTWQKLHQCFWEGQKTKKSVLHRWRIGLGGLWVWRLDWLPTSWHSFSPMCGGSSEKYLYDDVTVKERLPGLCWLRHYAHKYAFWHNEVRLGQSREGDCVRESAVRPKCSFVHQQPHPAAVNLRWDRLPLVRVAGRLGPFWLRLRSAWGKCMDRFSQTVQIYWAWDFSRLHEGNLLPINLRHLVVLRRYWRP